MVLWAGCGPPNQKTRYSLQRVFSDKHFSGKKLVGRTIMITPVLTGQGAITQEILAPSRILLTAQEYRDDLPLNGPAFFEQKVLDRVGEEGLAAFYRRIFGADFLALQQDEWLWKAVSCDYLLALKIVHGLRGITPGKDTVRQARVEGELWRCDSVELVWRAAIDARCLGGYKADEELLMTSIIRVLEALPTVPGKARNTW